MRPLFFLLLFMPAVLHSQFTDAAVSDSINAGLVALAYDTTIQTHNVFYDTLGDLHTHISQISGKQFIAIGPAGVPAVFKFDAAGIIRAWHEYEIENWISGTFGANYEGYSFSGTVTITCTITISGDTWDGVAGNSTDAFGLALYHLLIDPDFATYLP